MNRETIEINLFDRFEGCDFPCVVEVFREVRGAKIGLADPTDTDAFGGVPVVVYEDGTVFCSTDWQAFWTPERFEAVVDDLHQADQDSEIRWVRASDGTRAILVNGLPGTF